MRFQQSNPLMGVRSNLILEAALEVDYLIRLRASSPWLIENMPALNQEMKLGLLNELAYHAIGRLVPDLIADSLREDLMLVPISPAELTAVLARPLSDGLQIS
ncbi:hypothetical protein LUW10_27365 [Pseudomonas veronii]|uniref:hypothetical protein n=1 Tax=Pseudomonas veronii TaxID=76761 RepID=UPI000AD00FCF|nr:hypothetical protein [Pseudomonas veronii]MCT9823224.1 hypothetical protein [Pseudomonas veronii]UHH29523.1 hypothetical protein LUW10_27365 [Pseudomonas veronii]